MLPTWEEPHLWFPGWLSQVETHETLFRGTLISSRDDAGVLTAFALQLDPAWHEPRLWFPDALPHLESDESDESGTLVASEDETGVDPRAVFPDLGGV